MIMMMMLFCAVRLWGYQHWSVWSGFTVLSSFRREYYSKTTMKISITC
jgi:hypothetical protein